MHRFDLVRTYDWSGKSGTGRVATGITLPFRMGAVLRWLTPTWTVTWFPRTEWVERIHGHGGATKVIRRGWRDAHVR
jgi:hypothetical protein